MAKPTPIVHRVYSAREAELVARALIRRDLPFGFEPWPEGLSAIIVKPEYLARLDAIAVSLGVRL